LATRHRAVFLKVEVIVRKLLKSWRTCLGLWVVVGALSHPVELLAQTTTPANSDKPEREAPIPLAVICGSGFESWLSNVDYVFGSIQREELSDYVGGKLSKINDLKGFHRDKPFGMLIFLRPGLLPQPFPVTFIPVKNVGDAIGTLSSGPFRVKKNDETHYELITGPTTLHARLVGDYAWIATQLDQLDYEFPDPVSLTQRLADRYDLAIEFNLTQVPEGMKHIFLDFLRASTETSIQQRDGEPDTAYQLRRVNALSAMDWIDQLLLQGERLAIGGKLNHQTKQAMIEFDVVAQRDSDFSRALFDISARPSYFANVVEDDVPLTFSMSWMLTPQNQKRLAEFFNSAETSAAELLANAVSGKQTEPKPTKAEPPPTDAPQSTGLPKSRRGGAPKSKTPEIPIPPAIKDVFDALRATAKNGHVDFFVQFLADTKSDGKPVFTLIGGAKVADGTRLAGGATEILRQAKDIREAAEIELNVDTHSGITFHRLAGPRGDAEAEVTFGGKPSLYLGVGSQAVWFALGQADSLSQLKQVIDRVNAAPTSRPDRRDFIPFQFHMHMKKWVELGESTTELRIQQIEQRLQAVEAAQQNVETAQKTAAEAPEAAKPSAEAPRGREGNGPGQRGPQRLRGNFGNRRPSADQIREGLLTWQNMQATAFAGDDDQVRVDFKPTEQGARLRIQFDESFLRLLGLGVSRALDQNIDQERKAAERQQEQSKKKD
jgi:hypothetical protein